LCVVVLSSALLVGELSLDGTVKTFRRLDPQELAAQAAERVQERLQIIREKQRTDFAQESKAKALERLQVLSLSFAP
jgi:hypothetical protein